MKLGTPNACNDCHADKPAEWAAAAIEGWHGPNRKGFQNYAAAFHAAWDGGADASAQLGRRRRRQQRRPAFARAGALTELASALARQHRSGADGARRSRSDGADRRARHDRGRAGRPALAAGLAAACPIPVRGVRIRAAALLAAVPSASLPAADRERFDRAAAEFIAAQRLNADRPEARSALGSFYARRGGCAEAEAEYKAALR